MRIAVKSGISVDIERKVRCAKQWGPGLVQKGTITPLASVDRKATRVTHERLYGFDVMSIVMRLPFVVLLELEVRFATFLELHRAVFVMSRNARETLHRRIVLLLYIMRGVTVWV